MTTALDVTSLGEINTLACLNMSCKIRIPTILDTLVLDTVTCNNPDFKLEFTDETIDLLHIVRNIIIYCKYRDDQQFALSDAKLLPDHLSCNWLRVYLDFGRSRFFVFDWTKPNSAYSGVVLVINDLNVDDDDDEDYDLAIIVKLPVNYYTIDATTDKFSIESTVGRELRVNFRVVTTSPDNQEILVESSFITPFARPLGSIVMTGIIMSKEF